MKKCAYCRSLVDDQALKCSHCGSDQLQNVCNNCQTAFDSGFCPNCGTRAGEIAKACPNCGTRTFSLYCPKCGRRMADDGNQPSYPVQPVQPIVIYQNAPDMNSRNWPETAVERPRGGLLTALLIFFMPFIGAWVVLFGRNYKKGLRVFAIIWSLLIAVSVLGGSTNSSAATASQSPSYPIITFLIVVAPVVAYFIKIRRQRRFE